MSPLIVVCRAFAAYIAASRLYAHHPATRLFELDASRQPPAHRFRDDIDYVPSNRYILFGFTTHRSPDYP